MTAPNRALVLVDVQQEYFDGPLAIQYPPRGESLARILEAIDAATAAGTPVVVFQHASVDGAPVFDPTTPGFALHPEIEKRRTSEWKGIVKRYSSIFADTDLLAWMRTGSIDTITLVGYMTNNCIIASSVGAEELGVVVEVLSDATGAISIGNEAGLVDAQTVHTTLMALLNSNLAAVGTTGAWIHAVRASAALSRGDLPGSATAGAERFPVR